MTLLLLFVRYFILNDSLFAFLQRSKKNFFLGRPAPKLVAVDSAKRAANVFSKDPAAPSTIPAMDL
jgi:hypothetical protein